MFSHNDFQYSLDTAQLNNTSQTALIQIQKY